MKKSKCFVNLILIFLLSLCLQGYKYEYKIEPLDAAKNAANRNNTAIMYMEMGHYQAAENEFKIAISLVPNSPSSAAYYNNLGLLYLKVNNHNGATDCFKNAISINPVFLEYHKNLVSTYKKQGKLDAELDIQLKKIKNSPKNSEAYLYAGLIYLEKKNNKLAKQNFAEYLKLEKNIILARAVKQLCATMDN